MGEFDFDEIGFLDVVDGELPAPFGMVAASLAFTDIPPSVWDGLFNAHVNFSSPSAGVRLEYDSFVVQVFGFTAEEAEELEFDVNYGDGFPGHPKTQGMARSPSMPALPGRLAGREPMFMAPSSSTGVAAWKYATRSASSMRERYLA